MISEIEYGLIVQDTDEKIPAEPIPATARPMIKATEVGAAPQMTWNKRSVFESIQVVGAPLSHLIQFQI